MPPKELLKDLDRGIGKVLIKPREGGCWQELGEVIDNAIEIKESIQESEMSDRGKSIMIEFTASLAMEKASEILDLLINTYSRIKRRKTTYRTIRHDCAKRNGRR